ncbi:hypothetical protein [Flavobacterium microcysteis]
MITLTVIFFGIFILLSCCLTIYISTQTRNSGKKALGNFNLNEFEKYQIRFQRMSYPKNLGKTYGGITVDAILYYSQNAIIIDTEKHSFLHILYGYSFPHLFVAEKNKSNHHYKTPYSIYKTGNFPLRIKYLTDSHDVEISIVFKENAEEKQIVEKILNWQYK